MDRLSVPLQVTSGTSDYIPHLPVGSFRNWKKTILMFIILHPLFSLHLITSQTQKMLLLFFFHYRRKEKHRETQDRQIQIQGKTGVWKEMVREEWKGRKSRGKMQRNKIFWVTIWKVKKMPFTLELYSVKMFIQNVQLPCRFGQYFYWKKINLVNDLIKENWTRIQLFRRKI